MVKNLVKDGIEYRYVGINPHTKKHKFLSVKDTYWCYDVLELTDEEYMLEIL